MSFIKKHRPWLQQPQEVVGIDWGNPITCGLLFAALPDVTVNLVDGVALEQAFGYASDIGPMGRQVSAGALAYPAPVDASDPAAKLDLSLGTAFVYAVQTAEQNNTPAFMRSRGSAQEGWSIGLHGGSFDGVYAVWGSFITAGRSGGPVPTTPRAALIRADGSTAYAYIDGVLEDSGAYTMSAYDYNPTFHRRVYFGAANKVQTGTNIRPSVGLLWDRCLSEDEVRSISANPWQVFAPQPIWVPVSAGGSDTTVNGTLGVATAQGFAAGVNANRSIAAALGAATASGFTGTVQNSLDTTINGALGTALATGFAAAVNANRTIAAALGTAAASGFTGTVANSSDTTINGNLGVATAAGLQGGVNANRTLAATLGVAAATGFTGTVDNSLNTVINGTLGVATAAGLSGTVNASRIIAAGLGEAVASGLAGTVSSGNQRTISVVQPYITVYFWKRVS